MREAPIPLKPTWRSDHERQTPWAFQTGHFSLGQPKHNSRLSFSVRIVGTRLFQKQSVGAWRAARNRPSEMPQGKGIGWAVGWHVPAGSKNNSGSFAALRMTGFSWAGSLRLHSWPDEKKKQVLRLRSG